MSDQVQNLLQRVYEEGVNKAKEEAAKILESAKKEAEEITSKAGAAAEDILKSAQKKADDLHKNTNSDLKMAAQQTMSVIKQKLAELILSEAFEKSVTAAFDDQEFIKKLITETLQAWKASMSEGTLLLSEKLRADLDTYFLKSLPDVFGGELKVDFSPLMKEGFSLYPSDGTYKLSFTDEDFTNLFKSFLRPRTNQLLFKD
jgi:V/A-type H+-transporting ATPase subunit E